MKKRVFIVVFLCTTFVPYIEVQAKNLSSKNSVVCIEQVIEKQEQIATNIHKKMIKKELKRKKRLHRSLVEKYNETFNDKYLELIKDSSQKITNLQSMK